MKCGEALLCGKRGIFDLVGVAKDRRRDGAAKVHVEPDPVAALVRVGKSRKALAHTALQVALGSDVLQRARLGDAGKGQGSQRRRNGEIFDEFHLDSSTSLLICVLFERPDSAPEDAPDPFQSIKSVARRESYHNLLQSLKTIRYPEEFRGRKRIPGRKSGASRTPPATRFGEAPLRWGRKIRFRAPSSLVEGTGPSPSRRF